MGDLDKRQRRRARRRAALTTENDLLFAVFSGRKYMSRSLKRAYVAAQKREDRLIEQPCSEGVCTELIDPATGENTGGWGPVGCPCQEADQ